MEKRLGVLNILIRTSGSEFPHFSLDCFSCMNKLAGMEVLVESGCPLAIKRVLFINTLMKLAVSKILFLLTVF